MNNQHRRKRWTCFCHLPGVSQPCRMPPAPHVMSALYLEYKRSGRADLTFSQYLAEIGFTDPSVTTLGMDDSLVAQPRGDDGVELIAVPEHQIEGVAHVIVLLVDFPDRPGTYGPAHYHDLFFSKDLHPTGSVRDFYAEASNGKVEVVGTVHGWLRMPRPYTDYLGAKSGMGKADYPRNCQGLAEDAVRAAKDAGISFAPELDLLGRGFVTAFVLVHSGMAAELFQSVDEQKKEIWSHKWNMRQPGQVAQNLAVTTYLTVAQNCKLGVCAHELGHLLFQWQDFYDPNYKEDGKFWKGSGDWDLMASGSYNRNSTVPAHPAGLHKYQHAWVDDVLVTKSTAGVRLVPSTAVCVIRSPAFTEDQFLLLESRVKKGFDEFIPGEGLLVWRVDLSKEMFAPATPGMQLVQADGEQELESPVSNAQGDDGDPFPGSKGVLEIGDTVTEPSTSFPGRRSGVTLRNIKFEGSGVVTFDVAFDDLAEGEPAMAAGVPDTPVDHVWGVSRRLKSAVPKLATATAKEIARRQAETLFRGKKRRKP